MWVCGLKRIECEDEDGGTIVTPYVGVWIETIIHHCKPLRISVTPYVGVWIETTTVRFISTAKNSHTLCGCVD